MIIIINGSINSGKTTIAKILCTKIPNTAHIEIDGLCQFIDWLPTPTVMPLLIENTASLVRDYVKRGLNVLITYPIGESQFEALKLHFASIENKIYLFTLNPNIKTTLSNRGTRDLNLLEKDRVKYQYEIGINNIPSGINIDNTNQSPNETVNVILDYIDGNKYSTD